MVQITIGTDRIEFQIKYLGDKEPLILQWTVWCVGQASQTPLKLLEATGWKLQRSMHGSTAEILQIYKLEMQGTPDAGLWCIVKKCHKKKRLLL